MRYPLTFFLLTLLSCVGCSVSQLQNQGSVEPKDFYSKFPFETHKGVIGFDMNLDGVKKTFLFDTGADLSLIQRDSMIGKKSKYAGASKRKMELGKEVISSIAIGEIVFRNTRALNGDMVGLKEQVPGFGGIIGQSIIQKANWLIDYPNKEMELSSKNLADASFKEIKILRENGNNPYTFIEMNGKEYKVIIDLGSSSVINLPDDSAFATAVKNSVELSENIRERYTLGGLQEIKEQVGTIPKIRLGEWTFDNVAVNINTSSQPRIGMRFFKDYEVYIDHSNGGIYKLKKKS